MFRLSAAPITERFLSSMPLTFDAFGLSEPILRALRSENFSAPTPIQAKSIPILLNGADLMAVAQTGTGKTAAFGLPLLEKLARRDAALAPKSLQALVLVPTRELAVQVHENLTVFAKHLKLRHGLVIGGVSMHPQTRQLAQGLHVLVATVGRLLDHLGEGNLKLDHVSMLVLDEADRMLDMGFIKEVRKIASLLPRPRQSAMFSATMAPEIAKLGGQILNQAVRVQIAPQGAAADRISQHVIFVEKARKTRLLQELLGDPAFSRTIIFTRTKRGADRVAAQVTKAGIMVEALHGNKTQHARRRALARFASGQASALVATDIAARGIDVDGVSHVINYELPGEAETYIHRIGRTARAGARGTAVSFCDVTERDTLQAIEKLTGTPLNVFEAAGPASAITKEPQDGSKGPARAGNKLRLAHRRTAPAGGDKMKQSSRSKMQRRRLMPSGTLKWFNPAKGFGFIEPDDGGKDVFLHISAVERSGIGTPREGQRVSFDLERDQRGRTSATNLRSAE
jgi:ATP-dependent RNA helicase RhlE